MPAPAKKGSLGSRSEDTRRRIIEAAFEVFAERGYDGALTRDIARRAKVNHPLIIYHFKNKFGLWKECAAAGQHQSGAVYRQLLQANMNKSSEERLEAIIKAVIQSAARHSSHHRFLLRYLLDCPHVEPSGAHDALKANDVWVAEVIAAQAAGVLPAGFEPLLLQYIIVGMATRVFLDADGFHVRTGRHVYDPEVVKEHTRLVLAMLLPMHRTDNAATATSRGQSTKRQRR